MVLSLKHQSSDSREASNLKLYFSLRLNLLRFNLRTVRYGDGCMTRPP